MFFVFVNCKLFLFFYLNVKLGTVLTLGYGELCGGFLRCCTLQQVQVRVQVKVNKIEVYLKNVPNDTNNES